MKKKLKKILLNKTKVTNLHVVLGGTDPIKKPYTGNSCLCQTKLYCW